MRLIGRLLLFFVMLVMGGLSLTVFGGITPRYVLAPATLILVLGMTLVLGWLSYDAKRLSDEFKKIFTCVKHENSDESRRLLMQLAVYSLISGIILATVQVLVQIWDRDSKLLMLGSSAVSLRLPLTSVLYSVLTAMGFWMSSCRSGAIGQHNSNSNHCPSLGQIGLFSCLLVLTAGVLALLLLGMTLDQKAQENPTFVEMSTIMQTRSIEPMQILHEEIEGLYQGRDMVWRPRITINRPNVTDTDLVGTDQETWFEKSKTISDAILSSTDLPLRWEPVSDVRPAVPYLTRPAVSQSP